MVYLNVFSSYDSYSSKYQKVSFSSVSYEPTSEEDFKANILLIEPKLRLLLKYKTSPRSIKFTDFQDYPPPFKSK